MKPITLYTANCRENPYNSRYPVRREITTLNDLKEATKFDQVFAEYKDDHRAIADFIRSDCLPFDCDNDHSDTESDWKTATDVENAFPSVPFYLVYSRHHMKQKGKFSPRPRCQRQQENVVFRRNEMYFFGGQHTVSMQP